MVPSEWNRRVSTAGGTASSRGVILLLALRSLLWFWPGARPRPTSPIYPSTETGTIRSTTSPEVSRVIPSSRTAYPTSIIRWGETTGSQSGYDFTATIPPPFTLPGPIPFFSLGTFTHRNFEVGDPSLTSVQLDVVLVLRVDGVPTGPLTFTFTFNHEETPNNQTPCPYPTPPGEGCTDRVTIVASPTPTTFNVDGVDYTLSMSFLDNGNPVSEFITREGGTINSSGLVGEFTPPPIPPGTPVLNVDKSGPATMNPAEWGDFVIDVRNAGDRRRVQRDAGRSAAQRPDRAGCATPRRKCSSARVFAADGVTPVPGKGPLVQGTDYSLAYNGAACELTFNTLTAASVIGVGERLVIAYRTQLDSDYSVRHRADERGRRDAVVQRRRHESGPHRYTRTLTDGTVGTVDHEDAHTVTVVPRLYADKAVALQVDSDVARHRRSGRHAALHDQDLQQRPAAGTDGALHDNLPANTTYVADSLRLNGQPLGAPDGGVSPLVAGLTVRSSDLRCRRRAVGDGEANPPSSIRSARQRRRAARHGDLRTRPSSTRPSCRTIDRRRRQSVDGARADRRRRRQPAGAAHHEARLGRRRRAGARRSRARVRRAGHERRHLAGLCRHDSRRHRRADSGVSRRSSISRGR